MRLHGGVEFPFPLVDVRPEEGFADETRGPGGAVLRVEHDLRRRGDRTFVVHRVTIQGPAALVRQVGPRIEAGVPPSLEALRALAEADG